MSDFIHLHNHTHYKLTGWCLHRLKVWWKAAVRKYGSVALTDHGVMYGATEFFKIAKKKGVKPIIGWKHTS